MDPSLIKENNIEHHQEEPRLGATLSTNSILSVDLIKLYSLVSKDSSRDHSNEDAACLNRAIELAQ
jgi:hypothetical protein